VENGLTPLFCAGCGKILGASFIHSKDIPAARSIWYCYRCLSDIGRVADTLNATNVFSERDVREQFDPYLISTKPTHPLTILMWCDEQREVATEKEIDNLFKRGQRRC